MPAVDEGVYGRKLCAHLPSARTVGCGIHVAEADHPNRYPVLTDARRFVNRVRLTDPGWWVPRPYPGPNRRGNVGSTGGHPGEGSPPRAGHLVDEATTRGHHRRLEQPGRYLVPDCLVGRCRRRSRRSSGPDPVGPAFALQAGVRGGGQALDAAGGVDADPCPPRAPTGTVVEMLVRYKRREHRVRAGAEQVDLALKKRRTGSVTHHERPGSSHPPGMAAGAMWENDGIA